MPRKLSDKRYLGTDLKPIDVSPKKEDVVKNNKAQPAATDKVEATKPAEPTKPVKPEVTEVKGPIIPDLGLNGIQKEALQKFIDNPEVGLAKFKEAVENGELSEEDQAQSAPLILILERLVELKNIAVQTATVNNPTIDTEEKEMTTNTTKETTTKDTVIETNQKNVMTTADNLAGAGDANSWAGLVLAGATALVTTGYDMVLESDLSKERIIGSAAATVVAVGAQYLIQRHLTDTQSTAVNCAVGAGVGLALGSVSRMAIGMVRDKMNEEVTEL